MSNSHNDTLSHVNQDNNPAMVNVSDKKVTKRIAKARSIVELTPEISDLLDKGEIITKKGPVFQTAIIAGTMAAKKTGELIPLCHPIGLESCDIEISSNKNEVIVDCTCSVSSKTGVEMEALMGATVAALTIYDMCKAMSHNIVIKETKLMSKTGGKNDFIRVN
jgi:cyclic pyranopterin phosphate synthase